MTDTTLIAVPPAPATSVIDWAAVVAGAAVSAALSLVLFTFGTAGGIASVSPFSYNNPSATTLSVITAAWVLIVMIGSFLVGGYFAGRFRRTTGTASSMHERSARDGAHGLTVWAVGMVLGVCIAASVAASAGRTAAAVTGHAAAMAGPAAANAASAISSDQMSGMLDGLMRADPRAARAAGPDDQRTAVTRILANAVTSGTVSDEDKNYIVQVVAARSGQSEEEARRRVDAAITQVRQAAQTAKEAAEKARRAAAILAFLIGAASILAAGAAYWGATVGGEHRDGLGADGLA